MIKRTYVLDTEEQEIADALENKTLKPLPNAKQELKKSQQAAQGHGNKAHRVNIRLTEWDYRQAQATALREGIPYATLISSIIHKFFTGQLVQQRT